MAVVTLAVGVPEEDLVGNKIARFVTELRDCLKTWLENKMARCG